MSNLNRVRALLKKLKNIEDSLNTENDSNGYFNTLLEYLVELGDIISEFQDKVADEAYLNTLAQRDKIRKSLSNLPHPTSVEIVSAIADMRNILISLENLQETDQKKPKKCFMKCKKFKLSFWS